MGRKIRELRGFDRNQVQFAEVSGRDPGPAQQVRAGIINPASWGPIASEASLRKKN
jgi:hypothetical protein